VGSTGDTSRPLQYDKMLRFGAETF